MEWFPAMKLGWLNGWLLLVILYGVFGVMLLIFPRPVVKRLYDRSGWTRQDYLRRVVALVIMVSWFTLIIGTPLKIGHPVFWLGSAVYLLGFAGFVISLINYRYTPLDRPVTAGLYRISRNPQVVSLLVAFFGTSIAIGSWPALLLMVVAAPMMHTRVLAEERACLAQYGESYQEYMEAIPRYFLFF